MSFLDTPLYDKNPFMDVPSSIAEPSKQKVNQPVTKTANKTSFIAWVIFACCLGVVFATALSMNFPDWAPTTLLSIGSAIGAVALFWIIKRNISKCMKPTHILPQTIPDSPPKTASSTMPAEDPQNPSWRKD